MCSEQRKAESLKKENFRLLSGPLGDASPQYRSRNTRQPGEEGLDPGRAGPRVGRHFVCTPRRPGRPRTASRGGKLEEAQAGGRPHPMQSLWGSGLQSVGSGLGGTIQFIIVNLSLREGQGGGRGADVGEGGDGSAETPQGQWRGHGGR